jgi:hypothetical protein
MLHFRRLFGRTIPFFLEVVLIIFSILFAFWVDRKREAQMEEEKLHQYLLEIDREIRHEIRVSKMNLNDCSNDHKDLWWVIGVVQQKNADSLSEARIRYLRTFYKGVFREFGPTTLEGMQMNGDMELIGDPALRKWLTTAFGFRSQVEQQFLWYDQEVEATGTALFEAFDPLEDGSMVPQAGKVFQTETRKALFRLARRANYKAFILQNYLENMDSARVYVSKALR